MLTKEEIKYTIEIIFKIAFPNVKIKFENQNIIKVNNFLIEFNLMDNDSFDDLVKGKLKFEHIKNFDDTFLIPIFNKYKLFLKKQENSIKINADIISLPFLLLSRKEEFYISSRDKYGRYMYSNSLSYHYNIIDYPIVDEYAYLLRKNISKIINLSDEINKDNKVYLTHDIDTFNRFGSFYTNIKTIFGGDLLSRKSFKLLKKSIKELVETKKNNLYDPKIQAILNFNRKNFDKVESHFFFLAYEKEDLDYRYDIYDVRVKYVLNEIEKNNNFWGIHCGLNAYNNNNFTKQLKKISYYGSITENRNHYLNFDVNNTVSILEENNIKYDYSLGYPDRVGFKCGTCHEYNLYNFRTNKKSSVVERPLIVMDGSLKDEMNLSEEEAYKTIISLYKICNRLNGNFVILWHPDSTIREWENYYKNVYIRFLEVLDEEENDNCI